ncbi:MAG: hypothetical protein FD177_1408 [Desulfovibrionaceae bacterium]|nr:MAG: hypothetical protein FD177_1408 [Desulfovibrionaceae bacterium]
MSVKATLHLPAEFSNDDSAVVQAIYVANGEAVSEGDTLMSIEFSKAAVDIDSPVDGFVRLLCGEGQEVLVGAPLAAIFNSPEEALAQEEPSQAEQDALANGPFLSDAARRIVESDQGDLAGLGRRDFVRSNDFAQKTAQESPVADATAPRAIPAGQNRPSTTPEPLTPAKRSEVAALLGGQNQAISTFRTILRLPEHFLGDTTGGKSFFSRLSSLVVPAILSNACALLKRHRLLNARYARDCVEIYDHVALGYAIDLDQGLKVINLGDLDCSPPADVQRAILGFMKKYMTGKLSPLDLTGTTFAVTDVSALNVDHFTPLVAAGHSAILGICSPGPDGAMGLCLTFDHRVTEGKTAAAFLNDLQRAVRKELDAAPA